MKPNAGITSVRVATSGKFGLVKETVISFKVFNFNDYEEIVVPFFLTPGSTIFCDFGWNTADIYDPEAYLKGEGTSTSFEYKSFYDKILGQGGELEKSRGDMEVLVGLVSKFDSQVDAQGHFNCTITMTSQNYALLDYDQDSGIEIHKEIENKVWDKIKLKIKKEYPEVDLQKPANESYGENTKKYMASYVGSYETKNFFSQKKVGANKGWENAERLKFQVIPKKAYDLGIYFRFLDEGVATKVEDIKNIATDNAMYITFKYFSEILNDLLSYHPEEFTDGEISFVMEDTPVTFDKNLYIRQIFSTQIDKQHLMFLYPTRQKKDWSRPDSSKTDIVTLNEMADVSAVDLGDIFLNLDKVVNIFRNENTWRYPCKNLVNDGEICEL